jgi:hypothetical protein
MNICIPQANYNILSANDWRIMNDTCQNRENSNHSGVFFDFFTPDSHFTLFNGGDLKFHKEADIICTGQGVFQEFNLNSIDISRFRENCVFTFKVAHVDGEYMNDDVRVYLFAYSSDSYSAIPLN